MLIVIAERIQIAEVVQLQKSVGGVPCPVHAYQGIKMDQIKDNVHFMNMGLAVGQEVATLMKIVG